MIIITILDLFVEKVKLSVAVGKPIDYSYLNRAERPAPKKVNIMAKQLSTVVQFKISETGMCDVFATISSDRKGEMLLTLGSIATPAFLNRVRDRLSEQSPQAELTRDMQLTDFVVIG